MRKAIVSQPGVVEVIEVPVPTILADQVLVKVLRFSPYGTDIEIAAAREERYRRNDYPIGIGVDFSGEVVQVGSDVTNWTPGERVTATGLPTCGTCRECRSGRTNLCHSFIAGTISRQEVAQEYVAVAAAQLTRIPDGVDLDDAAMLAGVMTALNGLDLVHAGANDECVVIGLGAMGLAGISAAVARGCRVIGVGVGARNQQMARDLGCHEVIELSAHDLPIAELVVQAAPAGPSVVYESTCSPWGLRQAFETCGYGGRVVLLGGGSLPTDGWALIERELTVVGVRAAPGKSASLKLIEEGLIDLKSTIELRASLEDLPELFNQWIDRTPNRVRGRVMVDVAAG